MIKTFRNQASGDTDGLVSLLLTVATSGCAFTVVVPALPAIAEATGAGTPTATWILTGYLLASAVMTPILGRLGDVFGRRAILGWTLSVMLVGMTVGALAANVTTLIIARVLVGCGGGSVPLAMAIAFDEVPSHALSKTIGLLGAFSGLGSVVGLLSSSALMHTFGYRSLFWFPLGLLALSGWFATRDARRARSRRPDTQGARLKVGWIENLLLATWLTLPLVVLSGLPLGMSAGWALVLLGSAAAAYAGMRRLRESSASATTPGSTLWFCNLIGITMAAALFGCYALLPIFALQGSVSSEVSVLKATYVLIPFEIGLLLAMGVGGSLSVRAPRAVIVVGGSSAALAFVVLPIAGSGFPTLATTGVLGAAIGIIYPALSLMILKAASPIHVGSAMALNANLRTIGGALGAQVVAVLTSTASVSVRQMSGVTLACIALSILVAGGGALGLLLPADSGEATPQI